MYIRFLDSPEHEWESLLVGMCGINSEVYWPHKRGILTREALESHMNELLSYLKELESRLNWDDMVIGYQILGLLILQTGSYLPDYVKEVIMQSTTWEFDKKRGWDPNSIEVRKRSLKDFRVRIQEHQRGKAITSLIDFIDGM